MGSSETTTVLVLGAGPCGLVLGNILRAAGIAVLIRAVRGPRSTRDYAITCLALPAQAPPTTDTVVYGVHPDGFAGQMPRSSPEVTRYYLQCAGEDAVCCTEDRVWSALSARLRADRYGPVRTGPIIERGLVRLRSEILDPIRQGPLFLAGDAASTISPAAAKGANLAILTARSLAATLVAAVGHGDESTLRRHSADCVPRIRRAHEFSHWMIGLLHPPTGPHADFDRELQRPGCTAWPPHDHIRTSSRRTPSVSESRRMRDPFAGSPIPDRPPRSRPRGRGRSVRRHP